MDDKKQLDLENRILVFRGQRVIPDFLIAKLYNIETRALKQQVRRNIERFPADFMFELSDSEASRMVSQNVIPNIYFLGGAKVMAFTEQGVAMLSSVLRSNKAIEVNIAIMRTFIRLRKMMETNEELRNRISELEEKYDGQFQVVFKALKSMMAADPEPPRKIGFKSSKRE